MSTTKKSIGELSATATVLVSELSRLQRGSVATYEENFTAWLGKPVKGSHDIPCIDTVKRILMRDYAIVLDSVHGVGYRLLTHNEVVASEAQTNRARHAARRRKKELGAVEFSQLEENNRLQWAAKLTQSHLIEEATKGKSLKNIAAACNGAQQPLALAKALDAIREVI